MVDKKWFEAWQQYVDYEDINSNDRQHPGPVDNEALFNDVDSSEQKGKLVIVNIGDVKNGCSRRFKTSSRWHL